MEMPKEKYIIETVPLDCNHIEEICNKYLKEDYLLCEILPDIFNYDLNSVKLTFTLKTEIYKEDSPLYIAIPPKYFKCINCLPTDNKENLIKELHNTYPENELRYLTSFSYILNPTIGIAVFAVF